VARPIRIGEARPISAFRPKAAPGEAFSLVGIDGLLTKIQSAGGRWSVVEWSESKLAGWQTELAAEERGGLTRVGGSMAVQMERQGAMVVE
jgi:hypothetical protein